MPNPDVKAKLPTKAHIMCGWPLILVFIGGAIGGGLGGAAYGINVIIYRSKLPLFVKIILNIMTGLAAVVIWLVLASIIQQKISAPAPTV